MIWQQTLLLNGDIPCYFIVEYSLDRSAKKLCTWNPAALPSMTQSLPTADSNSTATNRHHKNYTVHSLSLATPSGRDRLGGWMGGGIKTRRR